MPTVHIPCPHCYALLKSRKPIPDGATILCRRCGKKFTVCSQASSAPEPATEAPVAAEQVNPAGTGSHAITDQLSAPSAPLPELSLPGSFPVGEPALRKRSGEWGLLLGSLGFLLFMTAVTMATYYLSVSSKREPDDPLPVTDGPALPEGPAPSGPVASVRGEAKPRPQPGAEARAKAKVAPADSPTPPATGKPLAFEADTLQSQINRAIDRGVVYLKASLVSHRPQEGHSAKSGAVALAGWCMLCCGVATNDAAVQKAAARVRSDAVDMNRTYQIALMILFLDRLGEPRDRPLIRKLAAQLIAGQGAQGGWTYTCEPLTPGQQKELLVLLQTTPASARIAQASLIKLPAKLRQLPVLRFQPGQRITVRFTIHEDNSLTQFALLALWAAQRHGVSAGRSLAMAEMRFRCSQAADGSWSYLWRSAPESKLVHTDSMTCAGLVGLALGHGVNGSPHKDLARDPAIARGLLYLGRSVGKPPPPNERGLAARVGANTKSNLYYLWGLERVAMAYGLRTIGGRDWYTWGAAILVDTQNRNGSWSEAFPGLVDTSFALLFLKRANVVADLTSQLVTLGQPKDPGDSGAAQGAGTAKDALVAEPDKLVPAREKKQPPDAAPGKVK